MGRVHSTRSSYSHVSDLNVNSPCASLPSSIKPPSIKPTGSTADSQRAATWPHGSLWATSSHVGAYNLVHLIHPCCNALWQSVFLASIFVVFTGSQSVSPHHFDLAHCKVTINRPLIAGQGWLWPVGKLAMVYVHVCLSAVPFGVQQWRKVKLL